MSQQQSRQRGSGPIFYQIDFTAVAAGKRVPTSKRRVRWYVGQKSLLFVTVFQFSILHFVL